MRRHWTSFDLRLVGLPFQDPGPVERDVGVVLFYEADGIFIERRAPDLDAGRRPEPVKDPGPALPFFLLRVDDEGVLVAALVAREPELRQGYFLFCVFAFGAAGFLADFDLAFATGAFALTGAGLAFAAVCVARFASATWDRCTSVKRV